MEKQKYAAKCSAWKNELLDARYTNTSSEADGILSPLDGAKRKCGNRRIWFFEGNEVSRTKWESEVRTAADNECKKNREAAAAGGHIGLFPGVKGPGSCGDDVWICDGIIKNVVTAGGKTVTTCTTTSNSTGDDD